jgi:cytochrome c-type biogenesis protein CcmE
MTNQLKFGLLSVAIVGTLGWLAYGGIGETATYYKEIKELNKMGHDGVDRRLRVGGDVLENSIHRDGNQVSFVLVQKNEKQDLKLNVVYEGSDTLPDTFKDGSMALVDGKLGADGVFHANKLQAKCASKYEAKPVAPATRS